MVRVPLTKDSIKKRVEEARANPQDAVDLLYKNRHDTLAHMRSQRPDAYDGIINLLGRYAGEEYMLSIAANVIRKMAPTLTPDPASAYAHYLSMADIEGFARVMARYHWTWVYSRHDFVISDNPLMRWHEITQRWNYGILHSDVVITMPLSNRLCLVMTQRKRQDHGQVLYCPKATVSEYNRRQRLTALEHVYAGDRDLLKRIAPAFARRPKRGPLPNFQPHKDR